MLETRRLRLRRLRPTDAADLVALDSDPGVMRYVGSPPGPRPPDETAERVRQRIREDRGPLGFWRVEARAGGGFHGLAALLPMPDSEDVEVAYRLVPGAWGRGIATEAAGALVDYALRTLGLPKVVAVTYPENRASRRVLEKLGFAHRGRIDYRGASVEYYVGTPRPA